MINYEHMINDDVRFKHDFYSYNNEIIGQIDDSCLID